MKAYKSISDVLNDSLGREPTGHFSIERVPTLYELRAPPKGQGWVQVIDPASDLRVEVRFFLWKEDPLKAILGALASLRAPPGVYQATPGAQAGVGHITELLIGWAPDWSWASVCLGTNEAGSPRPELVELLELVQTSARARELPSRVRESPTPAAEPAPDDTPTRAAEPEAAESPEGAGAKAKLQRRARDLAAGGLSQRDIAEKMGIPVSRVNRYLSGVRDQA